MTIDEATNKSGARLNREPYDHRNCQSLFGYAAAVHMRSGGICALCGYGSGDVNFDTWRQLTVEHLIGEAQDGYRRQIATALAARFPDLTTDRLQALASEIDAANTVTACSFCNSTTSRTRSPKAMTELIASCPDDPDAALRAVAVELERVLAAKRADVRWKLESVREAFDETIAATLTAARQTDSAEERTP